MPQAYPFAVPRLEQPMPTEAIRPVLPAWVQELPSVWSVDAQIEWLIRDMLPLRGVTLLSAASGTGKTWLAYAIAGAVAHGGDFLGLQAEPRPVLYFDGENPLAIVKRDLNDLGIRQTANLNVWGGWNTSEPPGPDDARILEFAHECRPLLIWDLLVQFHDGDEQSATETRAFMKHFRALANAGATVLVLHHTGKSEGAKQYRGSSDIEAAVDMAYTLEGKPKDGAIHRLEMRYFKSRFAPGQNFGMEFQARQGFAPVEVAQGAQRATADAVVTKIITENPGINGTRIKDLAKAQGIGKHAVDAVLRTLPSERGRGSERLYYVPEPVAEAEAA